MLSRPFCYARASGVISVKNRLVAHINLHLHLLLLPSHLFKAFVGYFQFHQLVAIFHPCFTSPLTDLSWGTIHDHHEALRKTFPSRGGSVSGLGGPKAQLMSFGENAFGERTDLCLPLEVLSSRKF